MTEGDNGNDRIMVTVYLRSAGGGSLLTDAAGAILDPAPYLPAPGTLARARAELERLGFRIEAEGGATLSASAPAALLERLCGARGRRACRDWGGQGVNKRAPPVLRLPGLEDLVEGMVIATPGTPLAPSP